MTKLKIGPLEPKKESMEHTNLESSLKKFSMVPGTGLEPARLLRALDSKSSLSTSFSIPAILR